MKAFTYGKQFFFPRGGNPGNVLLISRNRQKYFYHQIYRSIDTMTRISTSRSIEQMGFITHAISPLVGTAQ